MTSFADFYDTGTITLTNASTAFTGSGVDWTDIVQGDLLVAQGLVGIVDTITGASHDAGTLRKVWGGAGGSGLSYTIIKIGKSRFDPSLTQAKLREVLALLDNSGIIYSVTGSTPDPTVGEDGQYALKTNSGQWQQWLKVSGSWVLQGTPVGITNRGTWSNVTTYNINDVVARLGTVYLSRTTNLNHAPESNPSDWDVLGAKGDTGATGATGAGVRSGSGAPSNALGSDGDFYISTDTHFLYGPKASGTWPVGVGLVGPTGGTGPMGPTGSPGADGRTVRSGTGAPANSLGNDGDFYIATDTKTLYGPKVTGTWPAGTSITGPQGIQGATGTGINPSATGTLAQRTTYDNQSIGFVFLETDVSPFRLWVKASNTTADWAGPNYIGGTAPVGDLGLVTDSVLETFDYGVAA